MSLVVRKMPVPTIEPTVSRAPSQVLKPRTRRDSWAGRSAGTSVDGGVILWPLYPYTRLCLRDGLPSEASPPGPLSPSWGGGTSLRRSCRIWKISISGPSLSTQWGGTEGEASEGRPDRGARRTALLLLGERDHRLRAAVGGGDHHAGLALAVGALAGDAAARRAVSGVGALLRRQAGALELRLVVVDHLGRGVRSGDGEGRRASLGVGGVVGPLHRAAGVDRQPGGEVLRRAGAAEGGRALLALLVRRLDVDALAAGGVEGRGALVRLDRPLAMLGVVGADGRRLAGLLVLDRDRIVLLVGLDELEVRIGPDHQLGRRHGRVLGDPVERALGEVAHDAERDATEDQDHHAADADPGERAHALLDGRRAGSRRGDLRRSIHRFALSGTSKTAEFAALPIHPSLLRGAPLPLPFPISKIPENPRKLPFP